MIDCECVDDYTKDIHEALTRFFGEGNTITINGQCTDSGGGGTKFALAREIKAHDLNSDHYPVKTCILHNISTCLRNTVKNVIGDGGQTFKMNAMQMLHGTCNLQNWQEIDKLRELWKFVANNDLFTLKKTGRACAISVMVSWNLCL